MTRCHWLDESKPDYVEYHDKEWGVPVYDDRVFFEFLILESAQAGLSWYTILRRREGYRNAFANFDPEIVSTYDSDKVDALVQDEGIIRHRAKIESAINNAQRFLEVQKEFGSFSQYIWGFVDGQVVDVRTKDDYPPATTPLSDTLSKDLKRRGFKFVGSTTMYAFLQATGIVNDHDVDCVCRNR
ncbi:DNA-3-methyladenine glycosylase I [Vibrio agarivorans]|uniref:DNA-3-methyladenine glycosylase I n=1 Tax=Vibrio agarivorans TaxID=153622 RepID=A0ABT7XYT4_9VIBR|nr:DNA-3-methyladenine glycosylase I [Vibrio agarivorans]MDN2480938.1 DNA-3-methyladenine glycosylase I [Vibrio agarivorans]